MGLQIPHARGLRLGRRRGCPVLSYGMPGDSTARPGPPGQVAQSVRAHHSHASLYDACAN